MRLRKHAIENGKAIKWKVKSSCPDKLTLLKYRSMKKWSLTAKGPPPAGGVTLCQHDVSVDHLHTVLKREIGARCGGGFAATSC